ncbi:MAG: hypothetical protein NXI29_16030 [bacterium]|nr:hypothetical protein [bacterium]
MMHELLSLLILAQEEKTGNDAIHAIVPFVVGIVLILMGRHNIINRTAQGKKTIGGKMLGIKTDYEGTSAVQMGWIRILCGLFVIGVGIYLIMK